MPRQSMWGSRNCVGQKKTFVKKKPTKNLEGNRITSAEELDKVCGKFSRKEFSSTELERIKRKFEANRCQRMTAMTDWKEKNSMSQFDT